MVRVEDEDRIVFVESVLSPITVVVVPVDNQDTLRASLLLEVSRSYRDIVEDTKAHPASRSGVVAGRAHCTESVLHAFRQNGVDGIQHTTCGEFRCLQ